MIRADRLGVDVDGERILQDVTVDLTAPRVAVIGANGSGKSTFVRCLNGLAKATTGSVTVADVDALRDPKRARRAVGFLFSSPDAQMLVPTPAEEVALSLRAAGAPRGEIAGRTAEILERFGLAGRADQPSYSLSGGQKQLLALAAVLAREPRILVADEPTTLLDLGNARRMADLLMGESAHGSVAEQVIVVTHDLDLARRCDVAIRFDTGRLVDEGDPADVAARYVAEHA